MARPIDQSSSHQDSSLLLLSGGIESTTLLHIEARRASPVALFVDYAQRAADAELAAARWQCEAAGAQLRLLDMASVGEGFREAQTHKLHVPLPHRNLIILTLAVSLATQLGITRIDLALNREDRGAYPSAGDAFLQQFQGLSQTLGDIEISTPLADLTKEEIIGRGLEMGIDYARTYSCLLGYPIQCGCCPQCEKRRAAFATLGLMDPAGFKRPAQ